MGRFLGREKRASFPKTFEGMNVLWSPEAIEDLAALRAYISENNPAAAQRMAQRIVQLVQEVLTDNPEIGRPGRVPGTRELVVARTPYIVPYRVRNGRLEILRVYHGARRWPDAL
jgi:toxin ParE1/3/4